GGEGCTAIKVCKPDQDTRVDLPAFGLNTIRLLARYKYRCLAVSADKALFFDRSAALAEADAHGIVVVAIAE
ncbi:MAG: UDP-2,3-diacylglucosamine diphosphatase LpxI, partial [Deltaproteobacteria bacterium]|nr:UDP-2,3-diacylglucosamine diphosphatase LpxI [Deltaproteobacteria bacterium]